MASDDQMAEVEQADAQDQDVEQYEEEEQQDEVSQSDGPPRWLWNQRPWDAFKTFAIIFSFTVNFILLIVLLAVSGLILPIVNDIVNPIVGGLTGSFVEMSEATIEQDITIDTTMPIEFELPLDQTASVTLVEPVPVSVFAAFTLPGGGGNINGQVNLTLPEGLELPVHITTTVPVSQVIPVKMTVPVEIKLADTDLGGPFNTLKNLFTPLNDLLTGLPSSTEDLNQRILDQVTGNSTPPPEQTPQ